MMATMKRPMLPLVPVLCTSLLWGGYKVKELSVKTAGEYPAHQNFQNILIAAHPYLTEEEIQAIFDTGKLLEKNIIPVLIVVENQNDFAVRLNEKAIFLIDQEGYQLSPLPFLEVLLHISLKKPLSTYSTRPEILVQRAVEKEMYLDFEHKSFGEKLIAPHDSDYGIVFYWLPEDFRLEDSRLYLPEVTNLTENTPLMFFEFELGKGRE